MNPLASNKLFKPVLALTFIVFAGIYAGALFTGHHNDIIIIVAAALGGYMAINIGANDVANNVGPAVGAKALTLLGALVLAAVFESAGALIAGGDVVSTISKGIIDPSLVADSTTFIYAMMSALLAAALWLNLATYLGAPVSTTHSIVGGVMGAGIAAIGFHAVNWATMGKIAASWVISPLLGGIIAAIFLAILKANVTSQEDKVTAARKWIPLVIGVMASAFSCYLIMKGLKKVWKPDVSIILGVGVLVFFATNYLMKPIVRRQSEGIENRKQAVRSLFKIPLICSAALLSFAHGANDVANAVGPLAAILHSAESGDIASKVSIPLWVMLIGMGGISIGLLLFGPRLIRMVGEQITKLNPLRAFCVALSAAITVIIASSLGLPVSSTHITVGAVFGVGFFREYDSIREKRKRDKLRNTEFNNARRMGNRELELVVPEHNDLRKPRKLVRRSHVLTIIMAWIITVPASAILAAAIYYVMALYHPL